MAQQQEEPKPGPLEGTVELTPRQAMLAVAEYVERQLGVKTQDVTFDVSEPNQPGDVRRISATAHVIYPEKPTGQPE